jgi:CubicO group peptidase (beta-lactamase class C family)
VTGLLALLLALCPLSASAEGGPGDADPVETYLTEWREQNDIPGVAVAVVDGAEAETWTLGEDGNGDPVAEDTPFLIGSVSKTFTATQVLQLADEGRIELDEPVRTYLPWVDHEATVRQLLTHTAGYSAADGLAVSERHAEDTSVSDAARELEHSGTIGEYAYSSANYLVLGALIEQADGRPFDRSLTERVTGPTGMAHTRVDDGRAVLPAGHRPLWGRSTTYAPGPEPSGASYGYLVSTLDDLENYARSQLEGDLLPEDLQDEAWSVQAGADSDGAGGYGFGWRIQMEDGTTRVHHTGATPGFFTHVMLLPDQDRAIVILANAYSEARAPSLAAAAEDVDRLVQGGTATPSRGDPFLLALPWVALTPLAAAGMTGVVLLRTRRPRSRGGTIALVATSAAVILLIALAPMPLGQTWHTLRVWAPDVAVGLAVGAAAWAVAGAALLSRVGRISPGSRPASRSRRGSPTRSTG